MLVVATNTINWFISVDTFKPSSGPGSYLVSDQYVLKSAHYGNPNTSIRAGE